MKALEAILEAIRWEQRNGGDGFNPTLACLERVLERAIAIIGGRR